MVAIVALVLAALALALGVVNYLSFHRLVGRITSGAQAAVDRRLGP